MQESQWRFLLQTSCWALGPLVVFEGDELLLGKILVPYSLVVQQPVRLSHDTSCRTSPHLESSSLGPHRDGRLCTRIRKDLVQVFHFSEPCQFIQLPGFYPTNTVTLKRLLPVLGEGVASAVFSFSLRHGHLQPDWSWNHNVAEHHHELLIPLPLTPQWLYEPRSWGLLFILSIEVWHHSVNSKKLPAPYRATLPRPSWNSPGRGANWSDTSTFMK